MFLATQTFQIWLKNNPRQPTLTKAFVGYGHYRLTVAFPEGEKSAISGDMDLIERLNSEVEKEREEAIKEAIAFVQTSA